MTDGRLKGDGGYAIVTMPGVRQGCFPVHREDGRWKVATLAGSNLQ